MASSPAAWSTTGDDVEGPAVLRDGRRAWLRPVRPSDRSALADFVAHVSEESLEFRYFGPTRRESAEAEILAAGDRGDRLSLVAVDVGEPSLGILGHAEFAPASDEPRTAEVAFLIRDACHGQGLGTILLHRLAAVARARGIRRFVAWVEPVNAGMLDVFRNSGFPEVETAVDGTIRVDLPIVDPPVAPPEYGARTAPDR